MATPYSSLKNRGVGERRLTCIASILKLEEKKWMDTRRFLYFHGLFLESRTGHKRMQGPEDGESHQHNGLEPLAEVEGALLVVEVLHLPHPELGGLLRGGEHYLESTKIRVSSRWAAQTSRRVQGQCATSIASPLAPCGQQQYSILGATPFSAQL
jgi:hypothetical protein